MKILIFALLGLLPLLCFADLENKPSRPPIPQVIALDDTRYTQVEVLRVFSDRITFIHSHGVATIALKKFSETNLELLIPERIEIRRTHEAFAKQAQKEQEAQERERKQTDEASRLAEIEKAEARRQADTEGSGKKETKPGEYHISQERAKKYLGADAQAEMKEFLRLQGNSSPTQKEIDFALRFNERLEYHSDRAKKNPELYENP